MPNTRLGIPANKLGAALFFMGLVGAVSIGASSAGPGLFLGFIPMVLLAGYILLFEQNEWLRKAAVQAITVVILFALITAFLGLIMYFTQFIVNIVILANSTLDTYKFDLVMGGILYQLVAIAQITAFAILGFMAFTRKY